MRLPTSPGLLFRPLTMEDVGDLCEILQDPVAMTAYEHAFSMEEVYTSGDSRRGISDTDSGCGRCSTA